MKNYLHSPIKLKNPEDLSSGFSLISIKKTTSLLIVYVLQENTLRQNKV